VKKERWRKSVSVRVELEANYEKMYEHTFNRRRRRRGSSSLYQLHIQAGIKTDLAANAVAHRLRGRTDAYIAFSGEIVLAGPMTRIIRGAGTPSVGRRGRALSRIRGIDDI